MGNRHVRSEFHCPFQHDDGIVNAMLIEIDLTQRRVRLSVIRVDSNGLLEGSSGFFHALRLQVCGSQAESRREIRRFEFQRPLEIFRGGFDVRTLRVNYAQVVMWRSEPGFQYKDLAEQLDCRLVVFHLKVVNGR